MGDNLNLETGNLEDQALDQQGHNGRGLHQRPLQTTEAIYAFVVRCLGDPSPAGRCPWLRPTDRLLVNLAGYHDPFYWPTMQEWAESIVLGIIKISSDPTLIDPGNASINVGAVRQRFVRFKCVACRDYCEDFDPLKTFRPAVTLPCGHIMGAACYDRFTARFRAGEVSCECPWTGPTDDEPVDWTPECGQRIVYDCAHPSTCTTLPALDEPLYLVPEEIFKPSDGFIPNNCRRCEIKSILVEWTKDARRVSRSSEIFAVFAYPCNSKKAARIPSLPIDGLLEGESRIWGTHPLRCKRQTEDQQTLAIEDFLAKTPTPIEWILPADEGYTEHPRTKSVKPRVLYHNFCRRKKVNTDATESFKGMGTNVMNGGHDNHESVLGNEKSSSQKTQGIQHPNRIDAATQTSEDFAVQETDNTHGEYTIQGMDGMDLDYAHAIPEGNDVPRNHRRTEPATEKPSNQSGPMTQIL